MASVAHFRSAVAGYWRKYPFAPRYRRDERTWTRTADGLRLFAARLPGPPDAPLTVVLVHGFLNSSRSPKVHAFARVLQREVNVVVPDLRGHGESAGHTTLGRREALDVAAVVPLAARFGVPVVTVGTSLGAAAAILHAGAHEGVIGVVAISSPGWWGARDREGSARIARLVQRPVGRAVAASLLRTRIARLDGEGITDVERVVGGIAPAFTIIVHDPEDTYFGPEHAQHLYDHARQPKELWWCDGVGHGSDVLTPEFAARLLQELRSRVGAPAR